MENYKETLMSILCASDVVQSIRDNMESLLNIIPEISPMIGFEHKHIHHHLDVWEHTLLTLSFSPNNFDIRLALLLHDIGKPTCFQEDNGTRHFKGHPLESKKISEKILTRLGFSKDYVKYLCLIIEKHDIPLTENYIKNHTDFSRTLFEVQKCDALAHNPEHNEKRLNYIDSTTQIFRNLQNLT